MSFTLNSGVKIFDVIEALWENPISRKELCEKLKNSYIKSEIETISKYIRTLRNAGFKIKTDKTHPYEILKTPIKNNLKDNEKIKINSVINIGQKLFEGQFKEKTKLIKEKLQTMPFFEEGNFLQGGFEDVYSVYALENLYKISLFNFNGIYKFKATINKKRCIITPIRIKFKKNGIFISYYNQNNKTVENSKIDFLKNIKQIQESDFNYWERPKGTTFKITGKLVKNYVVREFEKAEYKDNYIEVTNYFEEKNELFLRLMKYGTNCEVVYPESDRKIFITKLKKMISHYKSM